MDGAEGTDAEVILVNLNQLFPFGVRLFNINVSICFGEGVKILLTSASSLRKAGVDRLY